MKKVKPEIKKARKALEQVKAIELKIKNAKIATYKKL